MLRTSGPLFIMFAVMSQCCELVLFSRLVFDGTPALDPQFVPINCAAISRFI